jgi:hypothetical protein
MTLKYKFFTHARLLAVVCVLSLSNITPANAQQFFSGNSSQRTVAFEPSPLCGGALKFKGNPYTVEIVGSDITVRVGEIEPVNPPLIIGLCPPTSRMQIDLGVLPPGRYTYTFISRNTSNDPTRSVTFPFGVGDARAGKAAPYVLRDYSGTWWDPTDPGWGLFIWQDAGSSKDSLLIAWFTYDPTGQPVWYTFQPEWATSTSTKEGPVYRSTRPLGISTPPPGDTTRVAVGTASIDFTHTTDQPIESRFTYRLGTGAAVTKKIVPFKP